MNKGSVKMNKFVIIIMGMLIINLLSINKLLAQTYTLNTFEAPPYVENNKGLAIDIIKELFKKTHIKYQIKVMPQKRSITTAQKKLQTAVFPIQRSQEREVQFKWVGPILVTQTGLFSLAEDNLHIEVFKDAFAYEILVARGSAQEDYLKGFGLNVSTANYDYQNIKKLKAKRARLWTADTIIASYYANKTNIDIKKHITLITTLRALAFHVDTPDKVIVELNNALTQMYKDGSIRKILDKYSKKFNIEDAIKFLE